MVNTLCPGDVYMHNWAGLYLHHNAAACKMELLLAELPAFNYVSRLMAITQAILFPTVSDTARI